MADSVLGGAATCSEGFGICFKKSSPCLLGQHGSCRIAQQPVELSENKKTPSEQVAALPSSNHKKSEN